MHFTCFTNGETEAEKLIRFDLGHRQVTDNIQTMRSDSQTSA